MSEAKEDKTDARVILDNFAKQLGKVKTSEIPSENSIGFSVRNEGGGQTCTEEFRAIMFKNAPSSDEECLIVEKGNWV